MASESPQEQGRNGEIVGYGRPPLATRFQPGRSGNPAGRPKGQSLTALLREALETEIDGKTAADRIVAVMVRRVMKGDIRIIKEIFDRTEGKAPNHIPEPRQEIGKIAIAIVYSNDWRGGCDDSLEEGRTIRPDQQSILGEVPERALDAVAEDEARLVIDGKSYAGVDFRAL